MWDDGGDDEGDEGENGCTRGSADVWQCGARVYGEVYLASFLIPGSQEPIEANSCLSPDTAPMRPTSPKSLG